MAADRLLTLIFIAGSWHQGRCYERIMKPLQERYKLNCMSLTLPSTEGDPTSTFKDDIDAARELITQETENGRDVVVIAHSFGGMVGNSAIKGLAKPKQPSEIGRTVTTGGVIGIILIASGFTLTGLAFMDPLFGIPPPSWRVNKNTGFAELVTPPRELFYHDLSAEDADYWISQLGHQNLKAMFEGGEYAYAGWLDIATWYIGTIEDRGLPVVMQRLQIGMARAMGGNVVHRELQSSHSPFLSMPQECVEIILEAIEAFTGESIERQPSAVRSKRVFLPQVRLLQPASWFRYGLPLGLGRIVGSCIAVFNWLKKR